MKKVKPTMQIHEGTVLEPALVLDGKIDTSKEAAPLFNHAVSVITQKDLIKLQVLGQDLKDSVIAVGEKYLHLCQHIRANALPPRVVTETLKEIGFHKVRISEINRVSQVGDELWDEFEARSLSFRNVLLLTRGTNTAQDVSQAADGTQGDGEGTGEGETNGGGDETSKGTLAMAKAAKAILNKAAALQLRSKKWTIHNGYVLTLSKEPAKKGKKNEKAGD